MKGILLALGFLTIIPVKRTPSTLIDLGRSMVYFPLVGLFMGAILVLANRGMGLIMPSLVTNLLLVVILIVLSGGIHLDGLADTLDGFYGGRSKEKALGIMRDSRIGVMGVIGVVVVLLAKWALLCEIPPEAKDATLLLVPTLGRWSLVLAGFMAPYARDDEGLGRPFAHRTGIAQFWMSGIFTFIVSIGLFGVGGIIILLLVILGVMGMVEFIKKKISGMTGDTFGFLCETVEILVLFLAVVTGINGRL